MTGSVSRGVAVEESDLELSLWTETIPSPEERRQFLARVGATDAIVDPSLGSKDVTWAMFTYQDVRVEAGWYTPAFHEHELAAIRAGEVTDDDRLLLPGVLVDAVPLRSDGLIARWRQELAHYPDSLQRRHISDAANEWRFPGHLAARWAEVRRGHRHTVLEEYARDIHRTLRILFAVNRVWEIDWKWLERATRDLTIRPDRFVERIEGVFAAPRLAESLITCLELIRDTLALAPPPHNVAQPTANVLDSLRGNAGR